MCPLKRKKTENFVSWSIRDKLKKKKKDTTLEKKIQKTKRKVSSEIQMTWDTAEIKLDEGRQNALGILFEQPNKLCLKSILFPSFSYSKRYFLVFKIRNPLSFHFFWIYRFISFF